MFSWFSRLLAAPVFEGDPDKSRVARLLNRLLFATIATALAVGLVAGLRATSALHPPETVLWVAGLILFLALLSLLLMRLGLVRLASLLILMGLWLTFTGLMLFSGGVVSIFAMGYVTTTIIAGLLLGGRAAILTVELSLVAALAMLYASTNGILPESDLGAETGAALLNLAANLILSVSILYPAIRALSESLKRARRSATALDTQKEFLEELVADRTRELEHRAAQLTAAAELGRAAVSILQLETLTRQVVELVRGRFDLHYVGLFLLDNAGEYVVLESGTGEPGRIMKEQRHKLEVGGMSVVGAACAQRQVRIAQGVAEEQARFDNPLLPETRSEMALPLIVSDRVIGVLDVQSSKSAAFTQEDVAILRLVADHVAVAVDNARKFGQEAEVLEATSPLFRISRGLVSAVAPDEIVDAIIDSVADTEADGCVVGRLSFAPDGAVESVVFLRDWNRHWASRFLPGTTFSADACPLPLQIVTSFWSTKDPTEDLQALEGLRLFLAGYGGRAFVNVPLKAGDRVIGFISLYRTGAGSFLPVTVRLYETLADQAAVALERARLLDEAQTRARREHIVANASARMRETLDMEMVLRTGVDQIAQALGLAALDLRLGTGAEPASTSTPQLPQE
jgi:GAF domain-containing protein